MKFKDSDLFDVTIIENELGDVNKAGSNAYSYGDR
jgi:hypothetical protein